MTPDLRIDAALTAGVESPAADHAIVRGSNVPVGEFVRLDGEDYYRIAGVHRMPPFLVNVPGDTDLWLFAASSGGLTAGRVDPDGAVFPYETVDRLYDAHHHSGPVTLLRVHGEDGAHRSWQPFADGADADPAVERRLYKSVRGHRLLFEEIHLDLRLAFRYEWALCDEFGLVRTATLTNLGAEGRRVSLLDGIRNVLAPGAPLALHQQSSCLIDAYRRSELVHDTRLAIYSLTSRIVDRAEASEQLRAASVFSLGLDGATVSLSAGAIDAFRRNEPAEACELVTGRRGHYLLSVDVDLAPAAPIRWRMAVDTGRSQGQLAELRARLLDGTALDAAVEHALDGAGDNLLRILAAGDALQSTENPIEDAHHMANVLFNEMRGGVFVDNHTAPMDDVTDFVRTRNRRTADRHAAFFHGTPPAMDIRDLHAAARSTGDPDLIRHALEYLPLYFGRRHGDPSRPWNRFSIRVRNDSGGRRLHYEGNWRDIFQNWEALCASFPEFLPGVVARFLNASTADGFNPYRLTRDGIDWEVPEPGNPWSHIGYWGDHQVVYLLRLLEALERSAPGTVRSLLLERVFTFADVPYRLRAFDDLVRNPRETIDFDHALAAHIERRVADIGTDGRLRLDANGDVVRVTLLEKLLVTALARLSNFVPGAGIWMNTQRPEWNDANNALVGNGCSLVTLYHLRRYLDFLAGRLEASAIPVFEVGAGVAGWLDELAAAFRAAPRVTNGRSLSDRERMSFLRDVGEAFSRYRAGLDRGPSTDVVTRDASELSSFLRSAIDRLDETIRGARRPDGLYHAYTVLSFAPDGSEVSVRPLELMLEGQVAALGSGRLAATEAVALLDALFASRLYRADQRSFLLYPARDLPGFLEKNRLPEDSVAGIPLLWRLVTSGDTSIVAGDAMGTYRFHADFSQASDVARALDRLAERDDWREDVLRDRGRVLDAWEDVFQHHAFTGRSGVMYAYEGLGSIYWHMVAKLLLAVQECVHAAVAAGEPRDAVEALARHYHRIRGGLGPAKTPAEFGAFPTDPYSHTPAHAGAQQPGMTGQVKEEILTRFGELGVFVEEGLVRFQPFLLRRGEFRRRPGTIRFIDRQGAPGVVELAPGRLAFTLCQVPVTYQLTQEESWLQVTRSDGTVSRLDGRRLPAGDSRALLRRDGTIARIDVGVPAESLAS
jgi:hypothetical protein